MLPRLIVFEGIDGSGKTCLSRLFCGSLSDNGQANVWLREPSDGPTGERIRSLARTRSHLPPLQELELFIADRRWDVEQNIRPALQAGKIVVLDRYFYSNACYQGARGLDMEEILAANRAFAPEADIVFVIDVEVKTALKRIRQSRQTKAKLFEKEAFLKKVRENFLKLSGVNIRLIDGNGELDSVFQDIVRAYRAFI